jgi:hypothetical protein
MPRYLIAVLAIVCIVGCNRGAVETTNIPTANNQSDTKGNNPLLVNRISEILSIPEPRAKTDSINPTYLFKRNGKIVVRLTQWKTMGGALASPSPILKNGVGIGYLSNGMDGDDLYSIEILYDGLDEKTILKLHWLIDKLKWR